MDGRSHCQEFGFRFSLLYRNNFLLDVYKRQEEDGTFVVEPVTQAVGVAAVGQTYYRSLELALEDAENEMCIRDSLLWHSLWLVVQPETGRNYCMY